MKGIGKKLAESILSKRCLREANSQFYKLNEKNIKLLTYHDYRYPVHAKAYSKAPIVLYYQGVLKPIKEGVAIIGNERYTPYSETVTTNASLHLIKANTPLISGLSRGIESLAQYHFSSNSSYQIAFVPHGLDVYYPAHNRRLINKLIQNGAVISEHPLGTKPIKAFFLKKNALVASWATEILLVEAHKTAHALGVIKTAKELSKSIFVVPNELYKKHSEGSNQVLSDIGQLFINQLQLTPGFTPEVLPKVQPDELNSDDSRILKSLAFSDKTVDELAFDLHLPPLKIIELMTILELESKVIKLPGTKYKLI